MIEITREQLSEWYSTMTTKDLMARLGGIKPPSLYLLLDKAGIPRKQKHKKRVDKRDYNPSVKLIG